MCREKGLLERYHQLQSEEMMQELNPLETFGDWYLDVVWSDLDLNMACSS